MCYIKFCQHIMTTIKIIKFAVFCQIQYRQTITITVKHFKIFAV